MHTCPRFAHGFQPPVCIRLYNTSVQATSRSHTKAWEWKMFAVPDKAKSDTVNKKTVKLTTVQVTKIGTICFPKPGLTKDLYILQKEEFSIICYMCYTYTWQRRSIFIIDNLILSSETMLHKDYDSKGSVAKRKIFGRGSQGAWCHDELTDSVS
jgi:hypothetical protein